MLKPNRHFSPVKLIVNRQRKAAVMLNPKVMTQSTRDLMAKGYCEFYNQDDPSEGRLRPLKIARTMPIAPLSHYLDFLRAPESYALFAFVRNPYARLVSAYKNKFFDTWAKHGTHTDSDYPRSIRQKHIRRVRRFATKQDLAGGEPGTQVPFETFLHYIGKDPVGQRDHHWCSQTDVLMFDRLTYRRIFKLETEREEGFRQISEAFGFDPDWTNAQLSHRKNVSSKREPFINDTNLDLVKSYCATDSEVFGYDAESWSAY